MLPAVPWERFALSNIGFPLSSKRVTEGFTLHFKMAEVQFQLCNMDPYLFLRDMAHISNCPRRLI
jgi:hypothetical protein